MTCGYCKTQFEVESEDDIDVEMYSATSVVYRVECPVCKGPILTSFKAPS